MSFNQYFNFEFSGRFNRNANNGWSPRHRGSPQRGSQRGYSHRGRGGRGGGRGRGTQNNLDYNKNFRQLVNEFSHQSISQTNVKPQYETIVLELGDNSNKLTEDKLQQHLQRVFGSVKKIWFSTDRRKAFVSFFNHMSVDMCIESGTYIGIEGLCIRVYPLKLTTPQELRSEDNSLRLQTLCRSNNRNLKTMFPSKTGSVQRPTNEMDFKCILSQKQLLNLVKIDKIDDKKLLEKVLKVNDINEQMDILLKTLLLNDSEMNKRNRLKDYLQELLNSNGFECRLHFIGSTINGLGFSNSDIDFFIETFDGKEKSFDESMASLKTIHKIFKFAFKMFIPNPIPSHRCPIVRLMFSEKYFIKNSGFEALDCDLNMSNPLGLWNSSLIRHFCRLEPRFQQLCILLRFWAKLNGFIGRGCMTSYAFTHLVLFFCQNEGLLPSVDKLRELPDTKPHVVNGWDCSFNERTDIFDDNNRNNESIHELLEKFFAFYANFDFSHLIICTKTGSAKRKSEVVLPMDTNTDEEVVELPKENIKLTPIITIEDPFELTHNLCANISFKTFDKFSDYIIHISHNFKQLFRPKPEDFEQNTDNNLWGLSPLCREWDPVPNGYAHSEFFIGYPSLELVMSSNSSQTPKDLMQKIANRLIDLTLIWISEVYRIECSLLSNFHLVCGQLSPFAEFCTKVRGLDSRTIDIMTRKEFKEKFSEEELKGLSFKELETQITDRIHSQFHCDVNNSKVIPIDCQFALVMNCRTNFPTVELVLIEFKPNNTSIKPLMSFLRRMIANASHESHVLLSPNEIRYV